jgi:hypothetical protein
MRALVVHERPGIENGTFSSIYSVGCLSLAATGAHRCFFADRGTKRKRDDSRDRSKERGRSSERKRDERRRSPPRRRSRSRSPHGKRSKSPEYERLRCRAPAVVCLLTKPLRSFVVVRTVGGGRASASRSGLGRGQTRATTSGASECANTFSFSFPQAHGRVVCRIDKSTPFGERSQKMREEQVRGALFAFP